MVGLCVCRYVVLASVLAAAAGAPARAATTVSQTRRYASGDDSVAATGMSPVSRCVADLAPGKTFGLAGNCFRPPPPYPTAEPTVDLVIEDAVSRKVGGIYWVYTPYCNPTTCGWTAGSRVPFCTSVAGIKMPPPAYDDENYMYFEPSVSVVVTGAASFGEKYCGLSAETGPGTVGTITATWHLA